MGCTEGWAIGVATIGVKVGLNSREEKLVNIRIINLHLDELCMCLCMRI